jgi:Flp pilus assembly protein TadB
MKKKISNAIKWARELNERKSVSKKELERLDRRIAYFQSERFAHLITTVFVGLSALITLAVFTAMSNYFTFALLTALVLLFCAYILHYYVLENGVQELCDLADSLFDKLDRN